MRRRDFLQCLGLAAAAPVAVAAVVAKANTTADRIVTEERIAGIRPAIPLRTAKPNRNGRVYPSYERLVIPRFDPKHEKAIWDKQHKAIELLRGENALARPEAKHLLEFYCYETIGVTADCLHLPAVSVREEIDLPVDPITVSVKCNGSLPNTIQVHQC